MGLPRVKGGESPDGIIDDEGMILEMQTSDVGQRLAYGWYLHR